MASSSGPGAALSPEEFGAAVAAVTSAFGDPTRRDIYLFVRGAADGVRAAEVADRFALHPNVARHHLEKLASGGYVDVELARHSTAGRPSKRYRAAATDTHLSFPPRRDDLLATLLARALERLPADEAKVLAEQVGYEYGRQVAARMEPAEGHRSVKAAVASVADALTAHGFAAHAEARANTSRSYPSTVPSARPRSAGRMCCAPSTPAWCAACSTASTARRIRSSRRAAPTGASTA